MCHRSHAADADFSTFEVRNVPVAAVDLQFACDYVCKHATIAHGKYVTVTGAHGIVESAYDDRIQAAHRQAFMVLPDGMPLVWLGRMLGFRSMTRVYGPDLMERTFADPRGRRLKHFFYGSNPAVISRLCKLLRTRFGDFDLVGTYSPPMQPIGYAEREEVIAYIRECNPDLIWVGLSTPKQELWMQMHMPKIASGIAIGVGAAFDLVSGTTIQAPRWIQRSGFEWLFRLAIEPKRLFRRYIFIVPKFLQFLLQTLFHSQVARLQKRSG